MKHTFCTLLLLYFFAAAFAQAPVIDWEKSLGGSDHEYGRKIQQTADGGYIMAGISFSNDGHVTGSHGIYDAWVVKLRADQSIEWQRAFGGSSDDGAYYVEQTADLGFIIGGFTKSNDGDVTQQKGVADTWFIKTDAAGNIIWQKTYGGSDYDVASVIKQTPDGGYIAAGYTKSVDGDISQPAKNGLQDWWLIKMDANGNKQWDKSYGGSDDEVAYSLDLVAGGGYIVSGTTRSADGQVTNAKGRYDIWTIRLDNTGQLLWQKTFGGTGHDNCHAVKPTSDGGFLVAGTTQSDDGDLSGNEGELDAVLIKYDGGGNLLWHTRLGGNKFDNFNAVLEKNGKYLVVGSTESTTGNIKTRYGKNDVLLLQFNTNGILEWQQQYGGSEIDDAFDLTATNDDGLVMVGSSFSNNGDVKNGIGGGDIWVVKWEVVKPLPMIIKQPENTQACVTSVASFTITATLADSYQWQILTNGAWQNLTDNAKYSGSNTLRIDIINVQPKDAQQYRCLLKNNFGETISTAASLAVQTKPTVRITPISSVVCTGIALTFTSTATGAANYFWQKKAGNNWQNTGNGNANYMIAAAVLADIGEYRCVVENNCGSTTSNTTILDVTECLLPIIDAQPNNATVCLSDRTSLSVVGSRTDTYAWQMLANGTWQPLADNEKYKGTASPKLEIINVQTADAEQYRCILKNMFGQKISDMANVILKQQPTIYIAAQNNTVCVSANASFSANGTDALQYNWQKSNGNNWQNIGDNKASFSIKPIAMNDAGRYRCVAANDCGSATSNIVVLEVVDCRIPNAFSPNGDGINDVWAIYFLQNQPESSVKIFNRDGAPFFESPNGYPTFWNGSHKGKPLPTGVYYYIIAAKSIGQVKGSVTLLR